MAVSFMKGIRPKTNREIVRDCLNDPVCDLAKYDRVLTIRVMLGGHATEIPVWRFMEACEWVVDQDTHRLVHFRLRWPQRVLYSVLCEQKMRGMPMRVDILKARQLGLSTFVSGLYLPLTIFAPNTRTCVMADLEDHSKNLFGIYQTFYEHLSDSLPDAKQITEDTLKHIQNPNDIRPTLSHMREGQMMKTEVGNSTIECVTAGDSAGRSAHYRYVHDSETAFQKDLEKTCVSLFSTVSVNDLDSIIIVETTANGYNDYKARWDNDYAGNTAFAALFFPWFKHPGYTRESPLKPPSYPLWFFEKRDQHPEVTKDQLYWYFLQYGNFSQEALMKQEYPWDPEDAFISSGMSVFDSRLIKRRLDEVKDIIPARMMFGYAPEYSADGQHIEVKNIHEEPRFSTLEEDGSWKVYKEPEKGKHYLAICDPTKGDNNDYSCIQVLEQNTCRQVAVIDAKLPIEEVAFQLYCAAKHWNDALVSSENNTGPAVLDLLTKMGYVKIYVTQSAVYDNVKQAYTSKLGHDTTRSSRDPMIQDFVIGFRQDPTIVVDIATLNEMQTFQYIRTPSGAMKAQASSSRYHDDRVMAFCPAWRIRVQQGFDAREANDAINNGGRPYTQREIDDLWEAHLADEQRKKAEDRRHGSSVRNVTGIKW